MNRSACDLNSHVPPRLPLPFSALSLCPFTTIYKTYGCNDSSMFSLQHSQATKNSGKGRCRLRYKGSGHKEVAHSKGLDGFNSEASELQSSKYRSETDRVTLGSSLLLQRVKYPLPSPAFSCRRPRSAAGWPVLRLGAGWACAKELCCEAEFSVP